MKKILGTMAAIAALALGCGAAMADDPGTKQLSLSGTVPKSVSVPATSSGEGNVNATVNGSNNSVSFTALVNTDLTVKSDTTAVIAYPEVTTNTSMKISLTSTNGGLVRPLTGSETVPDGFTNTIDYQASARITLGDTNTDTEALFVTPTNSTAVTGSLPPFSEKTITVDVRYMTPRVSGAKLMEGTYSDTLTLRIGSDL